MSVSECLPVTPLHCLVDVRGTPEKYQFILLRRITGRVLRGAEPRLGKTNVNKPQLIGIMRGEGRGRLLKKAVQ